MISLNNIIVKFNNNIYIGTPPNIFIQSAISLKNLITNKYIRHYKGKIIESDLSSDETFLYDSTFIICNIKDGFCLKCSNLWFKKDFFISYDKKLLYYYISSSKNEAFIFKN